MKKFYNRLSYSFGNEDWTTESRALKIQPDDRVLCITASGDRPLNLMMNECQEMVSIDANPIQNYLLALKVAAMEVFDYDTYIHFLGAKKGKGRGELFEQLAANLPEDAGQFWIKHQKMVQKGVIYQGAMEKVTKIVAFLTKLVRGRSLNKLYSIRDCEERRRFVEEKWDRRWWRKIFEVALNPSISKWILEDPGLANIGTAIHPGNYIYERSLDLLKRCSPRESLLFSLIFLGTIPEEAFSPYLTKPGFNAISQRLNCLKVETGDVVLHLESINRPHYDCFSLSDIASYMNANHFERLLKAVVTCARPGARFCFRQFLSTQKIPAEFASLFQRNYQLEQELEKEDRCFIYRFMVGEVCK